MNNEKWSDALNEVSDQYLEEALEPPKEKISWLGVVAGTVAAAMLLILVTPFLMLALFLQPSGSTGEPPNEGSGTAGETTGLINLAQIISLPSEARNQSAQAQATANSISLNAMTTARNFMTESMSLALADSTDNTLWSPVSAYMALATSAYLTSGDTRQELLDALGASSLDELTQQAAALWETVYHEGEYEKSVLAGSVWVDTAVTCNQPLLEQLSYDLYNSVYYADLGTAQTDAYIQAWVNDNTGNLLLDATKNISLPEYTAISIYSTIYFQSKWQDEFHVSNTKPGTFHTPAGDVTCDFMTKGSYTTSYYWGSNFSAICLFLKNGSKMWLILPDEGASTDEILSGSEYLRLISSGYDPVTGESTWRDSARAMVSLSLPKFDISCQLELDPLLKQLGIESIFDPETADFSEAFPGSTLWLEGANQAIRVAIDEEGATAAAYTEFPAPGAAPPPDETVDFTLDRPFLFVIVQENVPLFAGVINNPSVN